MAWGGSLLAGAACCAALWWWSLDSTPPLIVADPDRDLGTVTAGALVRFRYAVTNPSRRTAYFVGEMDEI